MKTYVDKDGLQDFTTKLTEKYKNLFRLSPVSLEKSLVKTARHTICGDSKHYIQGGCYVDSLGHFIFAFSPISGSGTDTTILVELDTDFETVINTAESVNYGHCNDLTYNPNTDRIYASSTGHESGSIHQGKVVVIDPSNLSIESTVDEITNIVSAISYDPQNDVYYTVELLADQNNKRVVYKYASDFNSSEYLGEAYIINPTRQVGQCSFVYDGEFYLASESNYAGHHVWFNTFGDDPKIWKHENSAYYETESIVEYNGKLYLVSLKEQVYIYFYELGTKDHVYNYEDEIYMRGTVLKQGADLNGVTQTGRYYETQSSAGTIVNTPYQMTDEFTLDVFHLGYDNLAQVLMTTQREIYVRIYNEGWGEWINLRSGFKYRGREINTGNWYCNGFVTSAGKSYRFSIPMEIESSVNAASITDGSIRILQNGNTLLDTAQIASAFSTVTVAKSEIGLSFELIMSTAPNNVVNNSDVIIQLYSAKILLSNSNY